MSIDEEEYEVLFTSSDYKNLSAKCKHFQQQVQKLNEDKKELQTKTFSLKENVDQLHKKSTVLNENINYLSLKGIEMSKTILRLENENYQMKESILEKEIQLGKKCKNAIASQKEIQTQMLQIITQNLKINQNLEQKTIEQTKLKSIHKNSRHIQAQPNSKEIGCSTDLTLLSMSEKENILKDLEDEIECGLKKVELMEGRLNEKESLIKEKNNKIVLLNERVNVVLKQKECLESELTSLREKSEVYGELEKRSIEKTKLLLEKLVSATNSKEELEKELAITKANLSLMVIEKNSSLELFEKVKMENMKQLKELSEYNERQQAENNLLKSTTEQLTTEIEEYKLRIDSIIKTTEMLRSKLESKNSLTREKESVISNLQSREKQLLIQIETKTAETTKLNSSHEELQKEYETIIEEMMEKENLSKVKSEDKQIELASLNNNIHEYFSQLAFQLVSSNIEENDRSKIILQEEVAMNQVIEKAVTALLAR